MKRAQKGNTSDRIPAGEMRRLVETFIAMRLAQREIFITRRDLKTRRKIRELNKGITRSQLESIWRLESSVDLQLASLSRALSIPTRDTLGSIVPSSWELSSVSRDIDASLIEDVSELQLGGDEAE